VEVRVLSWAPNFSREFGFPTRQASKASLDRVLTP
jgi:hypothetical protein